MNKMKFSYAPETMEDEYAFLAGRVAALEEYLGAIDSAFADVEIVRKILGIEEEKKNG